MEENIIKNVNKSFQSKKKKVKQLKTKSFKILKPTRKNYYKRARARNFYSNNCKIKIICGIKKFYLNLPGIFSIRKNDCQHYVNISTKKYELDNYKSFNL